MSDRDEPPTPTVRNTASESLADWHSAFGSGAAFRAKDAHCEKHQPVNVWLTDFDCGAVFRAKDAHREQTL